MQTWEEIGREWLPGGGEPPFPPEVIVAGFNAVRRLLGATWPEDASRGARGPMPLRWVVAIGCRIDAIEHLPGAGKVIAKIEREGWESSALGELAVAAAMNVHWRGVELEPLAPNGQSPPDVRVLVDGRPIHIEVARPTLSDDQARAWPFLGRLAQGIYAARSDEVLVEALVTWPTSAETEPAFLRAAASEAAAVLGTDLPLPGIGMLWISPPPPPSEARRVVPSVSRVKPGVGEDEIGLLSGHFLLGDGSSRRRVLTETRIPFGERLGQILRRKRNKQLPKEGHNLFVLDVTRVPEGLRIAPPLVERLFRQTQRVGAVVVFNDDIGRVIQLVNARARAPLPPGVVDTLERGLKDLIR